MIYLSAALAAPIAGPLLYWLLHDHPRAVRLVDGFVYVAVPILVAWHILPDAWLEQSWTPVIAVGLGVILPTAAEQVSNVLRRHTDNLALIVGLSGLTLHALLEGAALVPTERGVATPFALAVLLHRIPVGLVIWWLIKPRYGAMLAAAGVGSILLATVFGFGLGTDVLASVLGPRTEFYQAFVSGSLVHVVFHQGRHDHTHE